MQAINQKELLAKRLKKGRNRLKLENAPQLIQRRPISEEKQLSISQEQYWFLDQMMPNDPVDHRPMAIDIAGPVNIGRLQSVLNEIMKRHHLLSSTISSQDGIPRLHIGAINQIELAQIDLSSLTPADQMAEFSRSAKAELHKPFDLAEGPLFRAVLYKLSSSKHILLLVMHHVLCDGWSSRILLQDISALYSQTDSSHPIPPPQLQYTDFAYWQREKLESGAWNKQIKYWQTKLADLPPNLNLPTDNPHPAAPSTRGALEQITVEPSLVAQLKAFSKEQNVTLFMLLLSAFKVVCYRYTQQEDIVIGSPISGRSITELESTMGFFVNLLTLRSDFSQNPSFSNLLQQVRKTTLEAYLNQDIPFSEVVKELDIERNLVRSPLFQVIFNFENLAETTAQAGEVTFSNFEFDTGVAPYQWSLELFDTPDGLTINFGYFTDLYEAKTIRQILGNYRTILESILADPTIPVGRLPMLTAEEKHQLLDRWNQTEVNHPQICFHTLFEEKVKLIPDTIAVECGDIKLTYAECNAQANQLARSLRSVGIGEETTVGICLDRSAEMVFGIMGVLKAGGAFIPLIPSTPRERLDLIIQDAQIKVLLTQTHLADSFDNIEIPVIPLDTPPQKITDQSPQNLDLDIPLNRLAYIIYTSGSTGEPKGVLIEHRGLVNMAFETMPVSSGDRVLQFVSFGFDAVLCEMFCTFAAGATFILFPGALPPLGSDLINFLQENKVTSAIFPPSVLAGMPLEPLPHLHTILSTGEAIHLDTMKKWAKGRRFVNGYGPTETTVGAIKSILHDSDDSVTIGRPYGNTKIYLLDRFQQPVPRGAIGEIYISSIGVARGYLNRPKLTAEKFVSNHFDSLSPTLYKTGDLGKYRPDGQIDFIGRIDNQVQLRGMRVELGEIESVLHMHPDIEQAVILPFEASSQDLRLAAYVINIDKSKGSSADYRQYLEGKLPSHMVPASIIELDEFPLFPSGKINRNALPDPLEQKDKVAEYQAPSNEHEQLLVDTWQEILKLDKIGVNDNFFQLGGHSLLATQIIARCNKQFDTNINLQLIFLKPTISEMAEEIMVLEELEALLG